MDQPGKKTKKGVYFLADDRVIDLSIAFLNSFRKYNPEIPLCLIPYNNNCGELAKLGDRYNFSIFSNQVLLDFYDTLSLGFHRKNYGHFRKLAIWEGEFDEFIYIDIDTVVLSNFDFVFGLLHKYDFVTATARIPFLIKWVWKDSIYQSGYLTREQIEYVANSGFIASKKTAVSLQEVKDKISSAKNLAEHMSPYCIDQPFINYLIVTSGKKYSSINILALEKGNEWMKTERWAGDKGGLVKNGKLSFNRTEDRVLFLHWAGKWQIFAFEWKVLELFWKLPFLKRKKFPATSVFMPYKKLWNHYRHLHESQEK